MELLGKIVAFVVVMILSVLVRGLVLVRLWTWFILPLGAPKLSLVPAIGLALVVSYLTMHISEQDPPERTFTKSLVRSIFLGPGTALYCLGMGWIIHLFL